MRPPGGPAAAASGSPLLLAGQLAAVAFPTLFPNALCLPTGLDLRPYGVDPVFKYGTALYDPDLDNTASMVSYYNCSALAAPTYNATATDAAVRRTMGGCSTWAASALCPRSAALQVQPQHALSSMFRSCASCLALHAWA